MKMAALLVAMFLLAITGAEAHDWYTGTHNEKGWSCCGGQDCAPLTDGDVSAVNGGFFIASKQMYVPASRAQPSMSPDGHYHACFLSSGRDSGSQPLPQCFFYPPSGS
jgi:hypothetical protein